MIELRANNTHSHCKPSRDGMSRNLCCQTNKSLGARTKKLTGMDRMNRIKAKLLKAALRFQIQNLKSEIQNLFILTISVHPCQFCFVFLR
jgi:hypothetical protein